MNPLTTSQRQARRVNALEGKAREAGWASWSSFCTSVINDLVKLPKQAAASRENGKRGGRPPKKHE